MPLTYHRQLALHRALLGKIYPGRTVRAFLPAPQLMEIAGKTLDRSMPWSSAA